MFVKWQGFEPPSPSPSPCLHLDSVACSSGPRLSWSSVYILLATLDHFTLLRHSILEVTCDFFISFGNTLTPSPFLWKISGVTTFLSCHFVAWHWALPIPCRTQLLLIAPHGLDPLTFPAHLLPFLPGPSMHLTLSSLCAFAHALPRDW